MNTRRQDRVTGACRQAGRIVLVMLLAGVFGSNVKCVAIDGGASELTWSLRTFAGDRVDDDDPCAKSRISHIRLCWNAIDSGVRGCRPGQFRDFVCDEQTGVTRFEIPPGVTRLFVEPICEDGLAPAVGTYQVPQDIVRTVKEGEVVTLDSLLIVVTEPTSTCGADCTCVRE